MPTPDLDGLRKQFHEDGVVYIPGALDSRQLAAAREAYDWSIEHPGPGSSKFASKDAAATFYQDLANPDAVAAYRPMLERSPLPELAARLWNSDDVWFFYEQVFLKEGGESRRTPWHQDASYLPINGDDLAVIWISFEPVPKENALEFVRGSHRGTLYNGSRFDTDDDTAPIYPDGTLPRLPEIEAARDKWDIVSWAVEPRDVLVFHTQMLHGGAPTHPGQRRSTLSLRFFGADATYAPRLVLVEPSGRLADREAYEERQNSAARVAESSREDRDAPRSVFAKLAARLKPGDPFRHPDFLKLRPRA